MLGCSITIKITTGSQPVVWLVRHHPTCCCPGLLRSAKFQLIRDMFYNQGTITDDGGACRSYQPVQAQVKLIPSGKETIVTAFLTSTGSDEPAAVTLLYSHGNGFDLGQVMHMYR